MPQSVVFGDTGIEVSYIERRHVGPTGTRVQTILVNPQFFEDQIEELMTAVVDLIDAYSVSEVNPPSTRPGLRR